MAAEWRNGRMAEWQEWRNGIWNGGMTDGMAEWHNGRMAEMADGIHIDDLIVVLRQNGRMAAKWRNGWMAEWQEWRNGIWNGGMTDGMAEWQMEWQNGRMA
jgi:hypothetical protein